ncbi:MAG: ABC transporter substrate-binding protein [Patescibacteria group bacterium]
MKNKRIAAGIAIIIIIVIGVWIVAQKRGEQNPIRIVALFPLTGGLASYGESAQNAAQLAVEDINAQGGINGKKLEVLYQDHQCDPKTALSIFKQFSSTVKIFTSAACSGTVLSIAPNLEKEQTLLLGTIVTTPKITGVSPYVFRNWSSDAKEANLLAKHIRKVGYTAVGVLYEETDYAKGLNLSLQESLKDSGVRMIRESFGSKTIDVRTQLSKLKDQKIDIFFVSPQTTTSAEMILIQMEQIGFKPKLLINDNVLKAADLVKKYANILEGAVGGDYVIHQREESLLTLSRYKETFGSECAQTNICLGVYDAIHLLAQGVETNGYSAQGVQKYLQTVKYDGVSGTITFDEKNDRKDSEYSLFTVHNGMREIIQ